MKQSSTKIILMHFMLECMLYTPKLCNATSGFDIFRSCVRKCTSLRWLDTTFGPKSQVACFLLVAAAAILELQSKQCTNTRELWLIITQIHNGPVNIDMSDFWPDKDGPKMQKDKDYFTSVAGILEENPGRRNHFMW